MSSRKNSKLSAEQLIDRIVASSEKIDWTDYNLVQREWLRVGPGENGTPVTLSDPLEIERNQIGFKLDGFYTVVSEKISPNRSLPDIRLDV